MLARPVARLRHSDGDSLFFIAPILPYGAIAHMAPSRGRGFAHGLPQFQNPPSLLDPDHLIVELRPC
ncbi:MAG: hypothetical protein CME05_10815 [Gemmatimonadaceae bacterium]|nr:hypothetical protein [Gemmatimonadaceae bacterium]